MPAPEADRFKAPLLLAGAGKMGGAMLRAWLDRGYDPEKISVVEPHPSPELFELARDRGFALGAPARPPEILVLAIKPQSLDEAAAGLAAFASPETLVVSILAGKTIANIAAKLPQAKAIVRAMPNLAVGGGARRHRAHRQRGGDAKPARGGRIFARRDRRNRMARGRGIDRCGDGRVGFRARLCVLSYRGLGKRRDERGPPRRDRHAAGTRHRRGCRRIIVPKRR